jgi:ribosomal protein S18 acetylase RimI-like enzyme
MSDIEVRRAQPSEYDEIGELTVAAYRTLPVDHLFGGYDIAIRDVAGRADRTQVLVAIDGEQVLGAVTYATDHDSGWLEWTEPGEAQFRLLAVRADARSRGVGELLARACMERAASDERALIIHTTKWMEAGQRLYERLGFSRRPDRDVSYEEWGGPKIADLPPVWIDQKFLAFRWSQ